MKIRNSILAVAITASLAACGGNGSNSEPDTPEPETKALSGKAADGYLGFATVCLDVNNNKTCDSDEPTTTTNATGDFELPDLTQAEIDASPLLVEIIAGETIDQDSPLTPLTKSYTLSAPAGFT
ncbi:MAG: hypothetical protein GY787_32775, partial [Alteromonadales bacterium]|nr:hypothetical protein [Alteromonadales bacterium]